MTTDTIVVHINNYEQWRNQIVVFRALLQKVAASPQFVAFERSQSRPDGYMYCTECGRDGDTVNDIEHTDHCLKGLAERALVADDSEIARLAAELGGDA